MSLLGIRPLYHLNVTVLGAPHSLNKVMRYHWSVRNRYTRDWYLRVGGSVRSKRPPQPLSRAQICLTRYSSRALDHDNLAGSFKVIIDALKLHAIILDDTPAIIGTPKYEWVKSPRNASRITIDVKEIHNAPPPDCF